MADQNYLILVLVLGAAVAGLVAFNSVFVPRFVTDKYYCETAEDCVPEQCCHPTSAINKNHAPICEGTFCTQVCAPRTLDCNQGKIECVNNKCVVTVDNPIESQIQ